MASHSCRKKLGYSRNVNFFRELHAGAGVSFVPSVYVIARAPPAQHHRQPLGGYHRRPVAHRFLVQQTAAGEDAQRHPIVFLRLELQQQQEIDLRRPRRRRQTVSPWRLRSSSLMYSVDSSFRLERSAAARRCAGRQARSTSCTMSGEANRRL